jgi:hypothetical protein
MSLKQIAESKEMRQDIWKALEEIAKLKARVIKLEQAMEERRGRPRKDGAN